MKEISSRFLQVRGKLEIENDYDFGDDLQVLVTITDIQDKDNNDETIDRIYKAKLFTTNTK